ncbi:MAG: nicotinate-nucleotide adenylyltransferase [Anaerolineae bacterium]|nr:nicotinate (nicotinamide) nucleotide adenylyltransferase [Chloroflexota bacterium]MBP6298141.1 nicotinate-nucleotide adenylyltransferase [Anaerolineae bacterium]
MTDLLHYGIVGGTFDPPHIAHLILGEHGFEELNLTKVLYVPAGTPPHKDGTRTPDFHRAAMTQIAIGDNPRFELCRVDLDRPGPHYTVDMMAILRQKYPGAEFTFIMGEDMFKDLPNWKRAEGLFTGGQLKVAVMRRLGVKGILRADQHEDTLPGLSEHVTMLKSPLVEISSTDIARRIREGQSGRYIVPDAVLGYIRQHHLYEDIE